VELPLDACIHKIIQEIHDTLKDNMGAHKYRICN
jgi:hypothetical protein